jgi:methionyl-tRNA formyltransferase
MPDDKPFRLGLFADGPVGRAAVTFVLATRPQDLQLVVVNTPDFASSVGLDTAAANAPAVLSWDELMTPPGQQRAVSLELDAIVLCWWPYLIRGPLLQLARRHILNMHPSLLPHCRGKDPNFWCLVEGRPHGVTIHHVDQSVDGGDIAFQKPIPVSWEDTGETLYRKAEAAMIDLFKESYDAIATDAVPRLKQDASRGSFHRRAELDAASLIDLDATYSARDLLNLLRARTFAPHPACRFADGGERYEVRIAVKKLTAT